MRKNSSSKKEMALTSLILIVIMITSSFMLFSCGNEQNKQASEPTKITETKQEKESETSTTSEENIVESTTKAKTKTDSTTSTTKPKTNSTQSTTKATQATKVCYITIEGYCSNKKIELQSGDTVYDILKRSGANVAAKNTGYGIYIEGINGRFEFDEGPTSGWVYYVNGSKPNQSCNKYPVGNGDSITWDYVDEL